MLFRARKKQASGALAITVLLVTDCRAPEPSNNAQATKEPPGMVLVRGGSFQMGGDPRSDRPEYTIKGIHPVHEVSLPDFYLAKHEVTRGEYHRILKREPPGDPGLEDYPVVNVSWLDAAKFCNAKSRAEGLRPTYNEQTWACDFTANGYRLPTDAEWEYAARGGAHGRGFRFSGSNNIDDVAWVAANSGLKPHPVGKKQANEVGVYDMTGNVSEWCNDWYHDEYYAHSPTHHPKGPERGRFRSYRDCAYNITPYMCFTQRRIKGWPDGPDPNIGFRLARSAPAKRAKP